MEKGRGYSPPALLVSPETASLEEKQNGPEEEEDSTRGQHTDLLHVNSP